MSRLRWRCRRGIREMDLLLQGFLSGPYAELSPTERRAFERLLNEPDPELMAWVAGRAEPRDPEYLPLIERLRAARPERG
jgi:antitoxin CptB